MPEILDMNVFPSIEEFRQHQTEDSDFQHVRHLLKNIDGLWRYKGRCFIPEKYRKKVMIHAHQGHFGIQRTTDLITRYYYWPKYADDVKEFLGQCMHCLRRDSPVSHPESLPTTKYPFQRVAMDFAGPFPRTRMGNRYFLVIQDDFSRYLKIIPARECSANVGMKRLHDFVQEEGVPAEIWTDNGSHFCAHVIKDWMTRNNVTHIRTPPGHQASNGMAERVVRTIKEHLRTMTTGIMEEALMKIQYMYNRTVHSGTGYAPFTLARGRTARMPCSFLPAAVEKRPQQVIGHIWKKVSLRSEKFKNNTNRRTGKIPEVDLKIGDDVLVWRGKKGGWQGPRRVIGKEGSRIVVVDGGERISRDWLKRMKTICVV